MKNFPGSKELKAADNDGADETAHPYKEFGPRIQFFVTLTCISVFWEKIIL